MNYQQHQQQKLSLEMREGRSRKNKINTSIQMHIVNHFATNQIQKIEESIWISDKDASNSNTVINYWLINYHLKRVTSRNNESFKLINSLNWSPVSGILREIINEMIRCFLNGPISSTNSLGKKRVDRKKTTFKSLNAIIPYDTVKNITRI